MCVYVSLGVFDFGFCLCISFCLFSGRSLLHVAKIKVLHIDEEQLKKMERKINAHKCKVFCVTRPSLCFIARAVFDGVIIHKFCSVYISCVRFAFDLPFSILYFRGFLFCSRVCPISGEFFLFSYFILLKEYHSDYVRFVA